MCALTSALRRRSVTRSPPGRETHRTSGGRRCQSRPASDGRAMRSTGDGVGACVPCLGLPAGARCGHGEARLDGRPARRPDALAPRPGDAGGATRRAARSAGSPGRRPRDRGGPRRGDGSPADRVDPRGAGPGGLVGEAGGRVRAQVPHDRLEPHLPRPARSGRGRSPGAGGLRLPPRPRDDPGGVVRDRVRRREAAALRPDPLPQREPAPHPAGLRMGRRSARAGRCGVGGRGGPSAARATPTRRAGRRGRGTRAR